MPDWITIGIFAIAGASVVYQRLRPDENGEKDGIKAAREAYENGEITLDEYERRIESLVDTEADRIRNALEPINGVGEKTSEQVARHFETYSELRNADRDDLKEVHGVGDSTADAIVERLGEYPNYIYCSVPPSSHTLQKT